MAECDSEKENGLPKDKNVSEERRNSVEHEEDFLRFDFDCVLRRMLSPGSNDFEEIAEELKRLPISVLNVKQRKSLGILINRKRPLGGDYVDLAGHLFPDLNTDKLFLIEKQKNPTLYLLKMYENEKKLQATVFRLVEISFSMRRLDVVKLLLDSAKGYLEKPLRKRGLLKLLKRKLFQDDDTISISSVLSTASSFSLASTSYPSSCSLSSIESYYSNVEVPLKEIPLHFSVDKENNQIQKDQNTKKNTNVQNSDSDPAVFVVSASDEKENVVRLVKWFREKGIDAKSIETNKLEYEDSPSRFVKTQLDNSQNVLIICSPKLKMILEENSGQNNPKGDAQVVKYVFDYLNNEIFSNLSCKSKYIPLLPSKQSSTQTRGNNIPMPLSLPEAYYFETNSSRQDLLRRLFKVEKHKLPPIGKRPILRQNVITGELLVNLKTE